MSSLLLEAGAEAVTRDTVFQTRTPRRTETFVPVSHKKLIEMTLRAVESIGGYSVVDEEHGLWKDGLRYFGIFKLAIVGQEGSDYQLVLGVRNAHDHKFAAGICCGSSVFCCSNLSFSSDVVVTRKHTVHIVRDLPGVVQRAMGRLTDHRNFQAQRLDVYRQTDITDAQFNDILVRAAEIGVISFSRAGYVLEQWKTPSFPEFESKDAWSTFNHFTHVLKMYATGVNAAIDMPRRTMALHGLLDTVCGVSLRAPEVIDV